MEKSFLSEEEEKDNGSSLEKQIEELDKNDPLYAEKREKLIVRLVEFKKALTEMHKKIKMQRQATSAALKILHQQQQQNPQDERLQQLVGEIEADKAFLTRAVAEMVSVKGNLLEEMGRLNSSREFNQPIETKIVTDVSLKPLPSSEVKQKNEQAREIEQKPRKNNKGSDARKILNLRSSQMPISKIRQGRQRQNVRSK